jgi:hypothetical protein
MEENSRMYNFLLITGTLMFSGLIFYESYLICGWDDIGVCFDNTCMIIEDVLLIISAVMAYY